MSTFFRNLFSMACCCRKVNRTEWKIGSSDFSVGDRMYKFIVQFDFPRAQARLRNGLMFVHVAGNKNYSDQLRLVAVVTWSALSRGSDYDR